MKTSTVALVLFTIISVACGFSAKSITPRAATSGKCGDNVAWVFDEMSHTLTIAGTGLMNNYSYFSRCPWYSHKASIKKVIIGEGVTSIGHYAFATFEALENLSISSSVSYIGHFVCETCNSLTSVTIPAGVVSIGIGSFNNCSVLMSINVEASNSAFKSDNGVMFSKNGTILYQYPGGKTDSRYAIPIGTSILGNYSFRGCHHLKSIVIPSTVKIMHNYAFYETSLATLTIPASVEAMGNSPFGRCRNLTSITVESNSTHFLAEDGVLFDKNKTQLIVYPCGKSGHYDIPGSVTTIGHYAFNANTGLTSISIPHGVRTIHFNAFSGTGLKTVIIPETVTQIGYDCFGDCMKLTEIIVHPNNTKYTSINGVLFDKTSTTLMQYPAGKKGGYVIPSTVKVIGSNAFTGCDGLTSLAIPESVYNIMQFAFISCSHLMNVTYEGITDPSDLDGTFDFCDSLHFICVPEGYKNESFCKVTALAHGTSECKELHSQENECYEVFVRDDRILDVHEKEEASLWKNRTTDCLYYYCDNESGLKVGNNCSQNEICLNDFCVSNETLDEMIYVMIFLDEHDKKRGVDSVDVAMNLSNLIKKVINSSSIGIEYDDEGYIICIIIAVSDENEAKIITERMKELRVQGTECEFGLLCRNVETRIHVEKVHLSKSGGRNCLRLLSIFSMMVASFLTIHF